VNLNIYEIRRYGTIVFLVISVVVVALFLYYSAQLVKDLSAQERARMQIWADATRELSAIGTSADQSAEVAPGHIDFLLSIIEENRTIPVLLTDDAGNIIMHRNFDLPEPVDSLMPFLLSDANRMFLEEKLEGLRSTTNVIHIVITPAVSQHLYYEDSKLLRNLSFYPYVQVLVLIIFVLIVYYAVSSTKRAEQNKVWVGLSKETAHQLGTPISSLMAWMQYLPEIGVDPDTVAEMNKDVRRLETIASRFSKIGSQPQIVITDLNSVVSQSVSYMSTRISSRIRLTLDCAPGPINVMMSDALAQWVMENLMKNAVDAMEAQGSINIVTGTEKGIAYVEVEDSGKGLPRKNFKTIFNPGFTTKKRGWGLGLTLAKRIIEEYHHGRIFVKNSEPGVGTTFRIEFPLVK
jgi:Signal transduction histidine kinase